MLIIQTQTEMFGFFYIYLNFKINITMKAIFSILFIAFFSLHLVAQEEIEEANTLENQFDRMYRTSTSFQTYKVIPQDGFLKLKKDVLDSINLAKNTIADKNIQLKSQNETIISLNENADSTKTKLENALSKEENISLFGLQLNKTTYSLIVWSIIIVLTIGLFFYLYKYRNSHVFTKEAKERLEEVELDFEEYRKKTLIKDQKLRRQLQDEINKQK